VQVWGGDPDPSLDDDHPAKLRYNEGARASSLGMLFASFVTLALSPITPRLVERLGEGRVFLVCELVHCAVLLNMGWISSPTLAVANVAVLGIPFSAFMVIPYAFVGRAAAETNKAGAFMATMNLFMCLPELLVSIVLGPLLSVSGGSERAPMFAAAVSCIVATALIYAWFVRTPTATPAVPSRDAPMELMEAAEEVSMTEMQDAKVGTGLVAAADVADAEDEVEAADMSGVASEVTAKEGPEPAGARVAQRGNGAAVDETTVAHGPDANGAVEPVHANGGVAASP